MMVTPHLLMPIIYILYNITNNYKCMILLLVSNMGLLKRRKRRNQLHFWSPPPLPLIGTMMLGVSLQTLNSLANITTLLCLITTMGYLISLAVFGSAN